MPDDDSTPDPETERLDVPGFRSWRGVYCFVLICFVGYILLLAAFTHWFAR